MRQVIRRVGKINPRYKEDLLVLKIPHRCSLTAVLPLVQTCRKDFPCLPRVVKNPLTVAPAFGSKEKRHRKKFLTVRRRAVCVLLSGHLARPRKIPLVPTVLHPHISFCPFPETVKLLFHVHLHTHHHAVGHTLRARIMIPGVFNISHVIADRVIYFILAVEEIMYDLLKLCLYFLFAFSDLRKYIAVLHTVKPLSVVSLCGCNTAPVFYHSRFCRKYLLKLAEFCAIFAEFSFSFAFSSRFCYNTCRNAHVR